MKKLTNDQIGRLFLAVFEWEMSDGTSVKVDNDIDIFFTIVVTDLTKDDESFQRRCDINQSNIKKRWNGCDTMVYDGIRPNTNDTDKDVDIETDKDSIRYNKDSRAEKSASSSHRRFTRPSLDEVISYCHEIDAIIDPHQFYDYYESVGWTRGKSSVKDWKAVVRTWNRKQMSQSGTTQEPDMSAKTFVEMDINKLL